MLRFIDLGRQTWGDPDDLEHPKQFCFFNTVTDTFLDWDGDQVFDTREEFQDCIDPDEDYDMRCLRLIPEDWP